MTRRSSFDSNQLNTIPDRWCNSTDKIACPLTIAANYHYPYFYSGYDETNGEWVEPKGIENFLLDTLASKLNFTYELVECGQVWGLTGSSLKRGIMARVIDGEADMGIGEISVTYDRSLIVDYSREYSYEILTLITSKLEAKERQNMGAFISPFTWDTWLALGTTAAAFIGAFKLISGRSLPVILFNVFASVLGGGKCYLHVVSAASAIDLTIRWQDSEKNAFGLGEESYNALFWDCGSLASIVSVISTVANSPLI